jgi:hypothetical protein
MASFDNISLGTLAGWLTEAQTAYHALNTGTQVVSIGEGDTRLTFAATEVSKLKAYIAELQSALAALGAGSLRRKGFYIGGGKGL